MVASRSLVNLVDNDYRAGNSCLFELLEQLLALPDTALAAPIEVNGHNSPQPAYAKGAPLLHNGNGVASASSNGNGNAI